MKYSLIFGLFLLMLAVPFALADASGSVTVCKAENAVFEFELYNQAEPLTYAISPSGIAGTLSLTTVSLGSGEKVNFTFTVPTSGKAPGNYPFTIIADGVASVSRASGLLIVSNCYDSILSVSPTAATAEKCNSVKVKVSLQNSGSKQDSYLLSSTGDLGVTFSPQALNVNPSGQASSDAMISVPCSATTGAHTIQITSSGRSKQSATVTVQVTAPVPTPTPTGCAYSNPACTSPKVCQNNACVLPPGCKYNNPGCGSGFACNSTSNSCAEIPKVPAAVITSSIQYDVCRGESVAYDYSITNPAATAQNYSIAVSGVAAAVSPSSSMVVDSNKTVAFVVTVDTAQVNPGTYYFNVTAKAVDNQVTATSGLRVRDCYASTVSLATAKMALCPTQVMARTLTVRNSGAESDIFLLSAKAAPDLAVEFSPEALLVPAGEERTALVMVTAPVQYNSSGEARVVTIYSTANSVASTQLSVDLTPVASCASAFNPSMFLSAIRACKGEVARFKFGVYNPENVAVVFNITASSPLKGTLSVNSLSVPNKSSENVYYTVNTTDVALGSYPIVLIAGNGKTSGSVASQLQVDECFASNLTLVNVLSGNETLPIVYPSAVPTAAATPVANASSNATNVTNKPAGVLWAILPQGLMFESGLQKPVTVTIRNAADYDVSSVRVLISNMTVSDAIIPLIPAGKSVNVDLVVSTGLSKPFNATVRAVGEQGSGETLFLVNATTGMVAAMTFKSSASAVNGTNGSVERVNTTVRLYNYANAAANVTLSVREPAISVTPAAATIPANSYVEISLSTQLPKDKDYNATIVASSKTGEVYSLPVSLRAVSPSASTGLFSGGLVSMFSLAVVAVGVILVLFYFARKQPDDEDSDEDADEDKEEAKPKEEKKPAKKR